MPRSAGSTATINPKKMVQQELPFEQFGPGWRGKRYLFCSDGLWHTTLEIGADLRAETQCCADAFVVLPVPDGSTAPTCEECSRLFLAMK